MQAGSAGGAVVLVPLAVVGVLLMVWHVSRSRTTLEQWAADHGYELLQAERRYLRRGPYFWTTSKGQEVFFIVVKDAGGNTQSGWARVGGFTLGQLSQKVSVRWME